MPNPAPRFRRILQQYWRALCLGSGAALFLLLGLASWLPSSLQTPFAPIIAPDLNQPRLNTALPPPRGNFRIEQQFVAQHNGLQEIELLLVRWQEAENGRFTLRLHDADAGTVVATETLDTDGFVHNQTHLFRFAPQQQSAQRAYKLELVGSTTNPLSAWGYSLDVLGDGALSFVPLQGETAVPETVARDLRFTTRYRLTFAGALQALSQMLGKQGPYLLLALLFLPLPGCLLLLAWNSKTVDWDGLAWWGTAYALGVAAWPLLWFGLSLVGGRWRGWTLWLVFGGGWALVLWLAQKKRGLPIRSLRPAPHVWLLFGLLLLGLCVRLLAVRDLALPPWVDAVRHALITNVMVVQGRTPVDYAPFLTIDQFPYHFGFHTLSASLRLMTAWPLPDLLLLLGQLLNALIPLTVYAAVWLVTRRPAPGIAAAGLVALPFLFPAYYATWGRFTQLTAVLLLPVLLALTWLLLRDERDWRRAWWLVGLLAAGLFLLHFRVFIYYLPFAAIVWFGGRGRNGRYLAAAAGLGLLLVLPRVVQLWSLYDPVQAVTQGNIAGYNTFPRNYLEAGWEELFAGLAGVGILLVLPAALFRRSWADWPLALLAWVCLLFLSLAGSTLGLPESWVVNINSMYISLFVPLAIFLALVFEQVWAWSRRRALWWQGPAHILVGTIVAAALFFGIHRQITVLNPQTILAHPADREALAWVKANLPATARVAVGSWRWLGTTWSGSDGGAWLVPLTGLASTTPPADYTYDRALIDDVTTFNEYATAVADWSDPAAAHWLQAQGITHIFVGARGSFFDPAELAQLPETEIVYRQDGTFLFQLESPAR